MNKVTLTLAATTAGLTLFSIHLWRQLDAERDRARAAATQHTELQVRLERLEQEQHSAPALNTTPTAPPATSVAQSTPAPRREAADASDLDHMELVNVRHQKRWQEARSECSKILASANC